MLVAFLFTVVSMSAVLSVAFSTRWARNKTMKNNLIRYEHERESAQSAVNSVSRILTWLLRDPKTCSLALRDRNGNPPLFQQRPSPDVSTFTQVDEVQMENVTWLARAWSLASRHREWGIHSIDLIETQPGKNPSTEGALKVLFAVSHQDLASEFIPLLVPLKLTVNKVSGRMSQCQLNLTSSSACGAAGGEWDRQALTCTGAAFEMMNRAVARCNQALCPPNPGGLREIRFITGFDDDWLPLCSCELA